MTPSGIETATFRLVTQMRYRVFPCVVTIPTKQVCECVADSVGTTISSVYRKALFLITLCQEDDALQERQAERQLHHLCRSKFQTVRRFRGIDCVVVVQTAATHREALVGLYNVSGTR
jgi:hypothetical protein